MSVVKTGYNRNKKQLMIYMEKTILWTNVQARTPGGVDGEHYFEQNPLYEILDEDPFHVSYL